MLENSEGCENLGMKRTERCTPDYESMIKKREEKLGKTIAFRDAILTYFEGHNAKGKMAELIGELVTKCNSLNREIDKLVQARGGNKHE